MGTPLGSQLGQSSAVPWVKRLVMPSVLLWGSWWVTRLVKSLGLQWAWLWVPLMAMPLAMPWESALGKRRAPQRELPLGTSWALHSELRWALRWASRSETVWGLRWDLRMARRLAMPSVQLLAQLWEMLLEWPLAKLTEWPWD